MRWAVRIHSNPTVRIIFYPDVKNSNISTLPARNSDGEITVVIETPKGHRNKFKYDQEKNAFRLSGVLPVGSSFPYDFGFVPSTKAPDGDPIDVLLLMDEPASLGCLVDARLVGVIEAEQTEDGKTTRNDRLIAVATHSQDYSDLRSLRDVNPHLIEEIQHFFIGYNETRGKKFKPLGVHGPKRAIKLLEQSMKDARSDENKKKRAA